MCTHWCSAVGYDFAMKTMNQPISIEPADTDRSPCWPCAHVRAVLMPRDSGMCCDLRNGPAVERCADFIYEPGSDCDEF